MPSQISSYLHLPFFNFFLSFHRRPTALPFRPNHIFPLSSGITISLLLLGLAQELPWPLRHRPLPLTRRLNPSPCCSFAWATSAGAQLQRVFSDVCGLDGITMACQKTYLWE
ncbi:hypothetical protein SLEP1_g7449 [Rubroshorea leprosula]|uniref:Uncharacterized protein n=1 Tax=Rubroshorea leprosula TaxID=152421 RepID=A0AAV5I8B6_9ROSI|nr:hypothetical protein SLEP1_g7449 [Rubroshorea leprosula]